MRNSNASLHDILRPGLGNDLRVSQVKHECFVAQVQSMDDKTVKLIPQGRLANGADPLDDVFGPQRLQVRARQAAKAAIAGNNGDLVVVSALRMAQRPRHVIAAADMKSQYATTQILAEPPQIGWGRRNLTTELCPAELRKRPARSAGHQIAVLASQRLSWNVEPMKLSVVPFDQFDGVSPRNRAWNRRRRPVKSHSNPRMGVI